MAANEVLAELVEDARHSVKEGRDTLKILKEEIKVFDEDDKDLLHTYTTDAHIFLDRSMAMLNAAKGLLDN